MASAYYTEDQVRDMARIKLHLEETESAKAGVGQLTSFNQLGFRGVKDRPDGWYLPNEPYYPALILEVKGSNIKLGEKERGELLKNINIVQTRYKNVVGLLYNGYELEVFKNEEQVLGESELMDKEHYFGLFATNRINKLLIYSLTHSINDTLHFDFLIKNLYHRMIFTACALVAKRYGAALAKGMSFTLFTTAIRETLESPLSEDLTRNKKLQILLEVFSEIKLNAQCKQEAINQFIEDVSKISDNINSDFWNGEDVMAIFFNEFNRYKAKSESGQVFTPDHITSFIYRITGTSRQDTMYPRFQLTPCIAIFVATVIKNESVKYAFNNKWTKELMEKSEIVLPAKADGTPDFDFMERYIQSLPYSRFF